GRIATGLRWGGGPSQAPSFQGTVPERADRCRRAEHRTRNESPAEGPARNESPAEGPARNESPAEGAPGSFTFVSRRSGVEPASPGSEPSVFAARRTRNGGSEGTRTLTSPLKRRVRSRYATDPSGTVGREGFEPSSLGLKARCPAD